MMFKSLKIKNSNLNSQIIKRTMRNLRSKKTSIKLDLFPGDRMSYNSLLHSDKRRVKSSTNC